MRLLFLALLFSACVPLDQIPGDSTNTASPESASLSAILTGGNVQSRRDATRSFTNALHGSRTPLTNEMLPPLVQAAEDDDADVRLFALSGLEILSDASSLTHKSAFNKQLTVVLEDNERLYRALMENIEDTRADIRLRCVSIMSKSFRGRSTTESIFNRRLPFERSEKVRSAFIEGLALAPFVHEDTLRNLRNALQGTDTALRDRAGRRLAELRDEKALEIIIAFLRVRGTVDRMSLWNVVGQFGGAAKGSLSQLRAARAGVDDLREAAVADAALRAIRRGQ